MCNCDLCKFGAKLQEICDKYKLSEEDKKFPLNDAFMKAEYLLYEQEKKGGEDADA